jgi:hypothetical protein
LFSADIVLVNWSFNERKREKSQVGFRTSKIVVTKTYDQIRRTLGREVVRRVHRLGHAVVGKISSAHGGKKGDKI